MEWHAGLAGNAYVLRRGDRLRVLRPDWVAVIFGSESEPDDPTHALDSELIGFVYVNGGLYSGGKVETLLPHDVAHWCPLPDPEMTQIGMSWLTPAIREIQNDRAATEHKLRYWQNGATPNLVVKGIPAVTREQFDEWVAAMETSHSGVTNAYKTLYLTAGADVTVVGSSLRDLDLKGVQGGGETRIAVLSRVPAPILGIAEGLAGSSLNAGNFGMARRLFADTWVYPTLQDLAGSLADIVDVPAGAELWFDTADMPLLREDAKDAAEIEDIKSTTITKYVREGFVPDTAIAAVRAQDVSLLKHSGYLSVQLQQPGQEPAAQPGDQQPASPSPTPTRSDDDELEQRLAGADTTPGHDQLHHYWTRGEGLAKWAKSPQPWTTLYHHLAKYVDPEQAKHMASAWFHEVFGFWPGADLNRVTHGKPPRGKKVGPG